MQRGNKCLEVWLVLHVPLILFVAAISGAQLRSYRSKVALFSRLNYVLLCEMGRTLGLLNQPHMYPLEYPIHQLVHCRPAPSQKSAEHDTL